MEAEITYKKKATAEVYTMSVKSGNDRKDHQSGELAGRLKDIVWEARRRSTGGRDWPQK